MNLQDLKNTPFDIKLTAAAAAQVQLMLKHDFTLTDHVLRIVIKGKGCEGFTYSIQFTPLETNDITIAVSNNIVIAMDSFTAQFVRCGTIDFIQSHAEEGFHFINEHENLFHGKFFKGLEF